MKVSFGFRGARCALLAAVFLAGLASAQSTIKYNIGGGPVASTGIAFEGDPVSFFTGASSTYVNQSLVPTLGSRASHRYAVNGSLTLTAPVTDGAYTVILGFAEVYGPLMAPGKRVFSAKVNGAAVTGGANIDIVVKAAGPAKEYFLTVTGVTAAGGTGISVELTKGIQNPILSSLDITRTDGAAVVLTTGSTSQTAAAPATNPTSTVTDTTTTGGVDHQAHAVAGETYVKTDFDGDGMVSVQLDGSKSHTHLLGGTLTSFSWEANGKVISKEVMPVLDFPVGKTIVKLTITDSGGDVASEATEVVGLANSANGAYCYFYPGQTSITKILNANPKPSQGLKVENINWFTTEAFPFLGKTANTWAVRCILSLSITAALKSGDLGVRRNGRVQLYSGNTVLLNEATGGGNGLVPVFTAFPVGNVPINLIYYKTGTAPALLSLEIAAKPIIPTALMFENKGIIPVLSTISPTSIAPAGGAVMQLFGNGFFNTPVVFIGAHKAVTKVVNSNELTATIPTSTQAGGTSVVVFVQNAAGQSNSIPFTFDATTKEQPVKFTQTFFKKADGTSHFIALATSIVIGPDFNYYIGSQDGFLYKLAVNPALVVTSQCKSAKIGEARSVLGLAVNPWFKDVQIFFSSSVLFRKSSSVTTVLKNQVSGWANGEILVAKAGCGCFCAPQTVVSGLPVSHHDHSVNKMIFLPNGDMLITVAGATNGGHNTPGNLLGGLSESPLSASILLAKTSKGNNIAGAVKYDQYANPETSKVLPGSGDISVYATGLRNSFGIARTFSGKVYATDNGANKGFGLKSLSCTTQGPFAGNVKDELNLIVKGAHYGHANRAQGKCVWGAGTKSVWDFQSSTDGVIEYWANTFQGPLKGDIITSQYTTTNPSFQGNTNRVQLNGDGSVKSSVVLNAYSGVAVENGLFGEIVMPRVSKFQIAVLKPVYAAPNLPFVVAVTPKTGVAAQLIHVGGNNFKAGLSATLGGKACVLEGPVLPTSFKCITPGGTGPGLKVLKVTNPDGAMSPDIAPAGDFSFLF